MRKFLRFLISIISIIALHPMISQAATGCNYPTSLDSYVDKIAGDFLTIADVNNRTCALEKLQTGPLRPNDGSAAAPAYAFRTSAGAGMFLSAANQVDFATGGVARWRMNSSGHFLAVADSTYDIGQSGANRPRNVYVQNDVVVGGHLLANTTVTTGSSTGDVIVPNNRAFRWVDAGGTTTANSSMLVDTSNNLLIDRPAVGNFVTYRWAGTSYLSLDAANNGAVIRFLTESSAAPVVSANQAAIYSIDNGAGKTQLCAIFSSGAAQCFASQP